TWSCCTIPECRTAKTRSGGCAPRAARFPHTTSCCRTAISSNWWPRRGAPGTRARHRGRGRATSIRARSASRSPIPDMTMAIPPFRNRECAEWRPRCPSIPPRHRLPADRVLAHSDVAPARKRDPGERFPWKPLADSGIGLWVKPAAIDPAGPIFTLGETNPAIEEAQTLLAKYGYDVTASGHLANATRHLLAAVPP